MQTESTTTIEPAPYVRVDLDAVPRPTGPWARFVAHGDALFVDHAIFRLFYAHFHWVTPQVARSNNPLPHHLRRAKRRGIRTVVNLRGKNPSNWYYLEAEACRRLGLTLIDFPVKSRDVPSQEIVLGAKRLFDEIEYPALMHCKSGADRVGLMSTLYLVLQEGWGVRDAMKHLSIRYGHFRQSKTGMIDHFFESYLRQSAATGKPFLDWVRDDHDYAAERAAFKAQWWANTLVDRILRRE